MPKIVGVVPYGVAPARGVGQLPKLPDGAPCVAHQMCESEGCCFEVAKYGLVPYCTDGLTCIEHEMQLECERLPGGRWLGWQDDIERWICEVPAGPEPQPEPEAPQPLPTPQPTPPAAPLPTPPEPAIMAPEEPAGALVWMRENPMLVVAGAGVGVVALVALLR